MNLDKSLQKPCKWTIQLLFIVDFATIVGRRMLYFIYHLRCCWLYDAYSMNSCVGLLLLEYFLLQVFLQSFKMSHISRAWILQFKAFLPKIKNKQTNRQKPPKNPNHKNPLFVPGWCTVPIKYDLHYNNLLYED